MSLGCVPGQSPQDHVVVPVIPKAHVQVVEPYVHGTVMHAAGEVQVAPPSGCVAGHVGHVVQVHSGIPPTVPVGAQSQTVEP